MSLIKPSGRYAISSGGAVTLASSASALALTVPPTSALAAPSNSKAPVMSVQFTSLQAYVATLAMRLGKPLSVAQLQAMSPAQLNQAKASANTRLTKAQANAVAAKAAQQPLAPVSQSQAAALSAWATALGSATPQAASGLEANALLAQAGQKAKGQPGLVQAAYSAWLSALSAPQGQLALF